MNELRYSLRSLQNLKGWSGKVVVVGDLPDGVRPDIFLPCGDPHPSKEHNIACKILLACQNADISDDFIVFNDDHYVINEFHISGMKYWYDTDLREKITFKGYGAYGAELRNTMAALQRYGYSTLHYDIHVPIIYSKDRFRDVYGLFPWRGRPTYVVKSLYCNVIGVPGVQITDNVDRGQGFNHDMPFMSTMQRVEPQTAKYLRSRFPTRSRWETGP